MVEIKGRMEGKGRKDETGQQTTALRRRTDRKQFENRRSSSEDAGRFLHRDTKQANSVTHFYS